MNSCDSKFEACLNPILLSKFNLQTMLVCSAPLRRGIYAASTSNPHAMVTSYLPDASSLSHTTSANNPSIDNRGGPDHMYARVS